MARIDRIVDILGDEAEELLNYESETIPKEKLYLPGPDFIDDVYAQSDRGPRVLSNLARIFNHGRLGGTGYLSILPVDQGIEHSGGADFAPNPDYFDPEKVVELAIEGGCNAVASTFGVLGSIAQDYAHKIPFVVKLNHNELLTWPNQYDQIKFGTVERAFDMGAAAVGATVYFGSEESNRQIVEVAEAFEKAHDLGMATILWCYTRNKEAFIVDGTDYHGAADLTGQANHLGATIQADIIKQKQPTLNGAFKAIENPPDNPLGEDFCRRDERMYDELATDHPIDLTRYQVLNNYMGRVGLINSGGASGKNDLHQAVRTAVINKRAGGTGLISGRKAFQKPMDEGIEVLNAIQDVYLCDEITAA
ncbi:MAG: class I fructose-bisphosphate aldolase [Bradymonadaceae bacterium]